RGADSGLAVAPGACLNEPPLASYQKNEVLRMSNVRLTLALFAFSGGLFLGGRALADPAFAVRVDAPPAKKATRAVAKILLLPGSGFHVNKEYPTTVTLLEVPAGVSVERVKLTAKDAVKLEEGGAEFDFAFTSADAGKKTFSGEFKFAVCSASTCD